MSLGQEGEKVAEAYLLTRGYRILDRNWAAYNKGGKQIGELDIVAMSKSGICIVEVKAGKSADPAYRPELHMSDAKMVKIERAARMWLQKNKQLDKPWQIDLVAVDFSKEPATIRHYCHAKHE